MFLRQLWMNKGSVPGTYNGNVMKWTLCFTLFLAPIISNAEIKNLTVPGFDWHEPTAWSPMGVPTASDSVIIGGYVNILPGNNAYAEYIFIGENGWLEIERDVPANLPGRLFIRTAPGDAIVNKGKLENGGRIEICNAPNFGMLNQGELINHDRARIEIDSSNVSFHSDSVITNSGMITITHTEGTYALNLVGNSNMINHGDVTVRHGNNGILNQGHLTNFGPIIIDSLEGNGILNSQHIHIGELGGNEGSIIIKNLYGIESIGICIDALDTIVNHGVISIALINGRQGIKNEGYILNYDSLNVYEAPGFAIEVNASGHINNIANGTMTIQNSVGDGIHIAQDQGLIENAGEIIVSEFDSFGIRNQGVLINRNLIAVQDSGWHSIHNEGLFNQDTAAMLTISGLNSNFSTGYFNGEGDSLINSGQIKILNNTGTGMQNEGMAHNLGTIEIVGNAGVSFKSFGYLRNDIGSTLEIYNHSTQSAILILTTLDTVENRGKILVHDALTNGFGINNQGIFLNYDTLVIDGVYQLGFSMASINTVELINDATGYIKISNIAAVNEISECLRISSVVDSIWNAGEIFVSDARIGISNKGVLYNQNLIHTSMTDIGIRNGSETVARKFELTPSQKIKVDKSSDHLGSIKCIGLPGSHFFLGISDEPLIIYPESIFEISGTLETFGMNPE